MVVADAYILLMIEEWMVEARSFGLALRRSTPRATVEAIVRADALGAGTAWATVGSVSQDPLSVFAAAAPRTQHIGFGTSIVPVFPRHPLVLASQALVLADLAPGRVRLGIGSSHRPTVEDVYGIPFTKPLTYVREYLTVLRQLLWNGRAEFAGEFFNVHNAALPPGIEPPKVPILTSALRPTAFRMAGEIADGAISWVCPVPYLVKTALPAMREGAEQARRPVPPLVAHVPVAVTGSRSAVLAAARAALGHYGRLPFYVQMFEDAGFPLQGDGILTDDLILDSGIAEVLLTLVPIVSAEEEEMDLVQALVDSDGKDR
jgi:F420-dependent oxidoreductase-like protein